MSFRTKRQIKVENKSAGHLAMRLLLSQAFPAIRKQEESPIDVMIDGRKTTLFVDFYLPDLKVAIEVHGVQHDKLVTHFHGGPEGFAASKNRDAVKEEAMTRSGYSLIAVRQAELKKLTAKGLIRVVKAAIKKQGNMS